MKQYLIFIFLFIVLVVIVGLYLTSAQTLKEWRSEASELDYCQWVCNPNHLLMSFDAKGCLLKCLESGEWNKVNER